MTVRRSNCTSSSIRYSAGSVRERSLHGTDSTHRFLAPIGKVSTHGTTQGGEILGWRCPFEQCATQSSLDVQPFTTHNPRVWSAMVCAMSSVPSCVACSLTSFRPESIGRCAPRVEPLRFELGLALSILRSLTCISLRIILHCLR